MPKLNKAQKREKRRFKAQYGHKVDGKSVFTIQREIAKRGKK